MHNFVEVYLPEKINNNNKTRNLDDASRFGSIEAVSYVFMFTTGLILSLIRMMEPYFRHVIWKTINEYFGNIIPEPDKGITSKPLNSYLAESLNVELINIIL